MAFSRTTCPMQARWMADEAERDKLKAKPSLTAKEAKRLRMLELREVPRCAYSTSPWAYTQECAKIEKKVVRTFPKPTRLVLEALRRGFSEAAIAEHIGWSIDKLHAAILKVKPIFRKRVLDVPSHPIGVCPFHVTEETQLVHEDYAVFVDNVHRPNHFEVGFDGKRIIDSHQGEWARKHLSGESNKRPNGISDLGWVSLNPEVAFEGQATGNVDTIEVVKTETEWWPTKKEFLVGYNLSYDALTLLLDGGGSTTYMGWTWEEVWEAHHEPVVVKTYRRVWTFEHMAAGDTVDPGEFLPDETYSVGGSSVPLLREVPELMGKQGWTKHCPCYVPRWGQKKVRLMRGWERTRPYFKVRGLTTKGHEVEGWFLGWKGKNMRVRASGKFSKFNAPGPVVLMPEGEVTWSSPNDQKVYEGRILKRS